MTGSATPAVLAAGKGMAAAPKKPGPLGEATKTPDYKLASAVETHCPTSGDAA